MQTLDADCGEVTDHPKRSFSTRRGLPLVIVAVIDCVWLSAGLETPCFVGDLWLRTIGSEPLVGDTRGYGTWFSAWS